MSGTGSAGMEACFVNLIEKDDPVLVLINGVFGMRMQDVAQRLRANVDTLEFEWGAPVAVDTVKSKIAATHYKIVAVVHAETSTGVKNPVAEIGQLLKGSDTIYLVDAVTSLGGIEIAMDAWGIDALYSGTQKCLSCPPGLAPLSFSDKAIAVLENRKTKVPNWYLDLSMIMKYWKGATRAYHHTAPINMHYGLYQALKLIMAEGPDNVYQRHLHYHNELVDGLEALGLSMLVAPASRLPMLNSVRVPDGVDEAAVRRTLLDEYKIEIGAGLGPLAGKIWRIGLMGHTARHENVARLLSALKSILD
jgi:alanine-glyoxylate transaminase/serine-glyoxylate transaminase/serine-pyruvate transaminase